MPPAVFCAYIEVTLHPKHTSAAAAHSPPQVTAVGLPVVHRHCPQRSFGGALCGPRPPGSTPSAEATPKTACRDRREKYLPKNVH